MPIVTWPESRPRWKAKLDHSESTSPVSSISTPSTFGALTTEIVSRLVSRNWKLRDSGKLAASTEATSVAWDTRR